MQPGKWRWHPFAWIFLAEMFVAAGLAYDDWKIDSDLYARSLALALGVPFLWPAFRIMTERKSPLIGMIAGVAGNFAWTFVGGRLYPAGGPCLTHFMAMWWLPDMLFFANVIVLLLLAPRAMSAAIGRVRRPTHP